MPEADQFLLFVDALNDLDLRFMVTGSVATILYGEPRMTHDVDLVLELDVSSASDLASRFPIEDYYFPPIEVVRLEAARHQRGHFNIIHHKSGLKADIYLAGDDPLHRAALEAVNTVEIDGRTIPLAPPSYVIARKLQYFREGGSDKHLRDIRGMVQSLGDSIDRTQVEEFATMAGVCDLLPSIGL